MNEYETSKSKELLRSEQAHGIALKLKERANDVDENRRIELDHIRWLADDVRQRWAEDERLSGSVAFVDEHGGFAALARYEDETSDLDVRHRAFYKTYDGEDAGVERELRIPRELVGEAVDLYSEDARIYDFTDKMAAGNFIEREDVAEFTEDIAWLGEKFGLSLFSERRFLSTPRLRTNEKVVFIGTESIIPFDAATFQ